MSAVRRPHLDDTERLDDVRTVMGLGLSHRSLDRLARIARRLVDADDARITLVDDAHSHLIGAASPSATASGHRPVPHAELAGLPVVGANAPLCIEDLRKSPAGGASQNRAYLGVPLRSMRGHAIGIVSATSAHPRIWAGSDVASLQDLAESVVTEIELRSDGVERSRAEDALRESEERFRVLVEGSREVFFYIHGKDDCFQYLSPSVEHVLGYPAEDLIGRPYHVLLVDDERTQRRVTQLTERSYDPAASASTYSALTRHRSGREVVVELVETPIVREGMVVGVQGIARDITKRSHAEREVQLQKAHFEHLFESAPEGIVVLDEEDRIVRVNTEFLRIFGYRRDEAVGHAIHDLIVPEERRPRSVSLTRAVWGGRRVNTEATRTRKDGLALKVSILAAPLRVQGEPVAVYGIYRDITRERQKDRQLRQAERLASIGTLLSGVAHELNNPLTSVKSFSQLLLSEPRSDDDREALEIIEREVERAAKVVRDLQVFAHQADAREQEPTGPVDVTDVVRHVLRLREYALRTHNITISTSLPEGTPTVSGDRARLEQVVLNLLINAEHALRGVPSGRRRIRISTDHEDGVVVLRVGDSGSGLAMEHLERIFDPFWTTKAPGDGMGLGLSLVHSIVTEHGGTVRAGQRSGGGAVFTVSLPVADSADPVMERPGDGAPAGDALHILVVDDEEAIRSSLERLLTRTGHRVATATDGREALERIDRAGSDPFDAMVADLRMPGMGGDELLAVLQDRDHGLARRAILITGDAANPETAEIIAEADVPVLVKPFGKVELRDLLQRVMREAESETLSR